MHWLPTKSDLSNSSPLSICLTLESEGLQQSVQIHLQVQKKQQPQNTACHKHQFYEVKLYRLTCLISSGQLQYLWYNYSVLSGLQTHHVKQHPLLMIRKLQNKTCHEADFVNQMTFFY